MIIVFFGNTKYSVIDAEIIYKHLGLTAVITIPDRLNIQKKILIPSPVKSFAVTNNIPFITADKLDNTIIEQINKLQPDFLIVADYRQILPEKLLNIPKFAALNIHHSLLPKYRGTSPAPTALLNGDKVSGVTIIAMNNKVDAGDILTQKEYRLQQDETTDSLLTHLNELGAQAVTEVIKNYKNIQPKKQDESKATFTRKMEKHDGFIDVNNPPHFEQLDRMIHAYYPWPTVWTICTFPNSKLDGRIIKFLPAHICYSELGSRKVWENIFCVQVEGKKPTPIKDFLNGYPEVKPWLGQLLEKK